MPSQVYVNPSRLDLDVVLSSASAFYPQSPIASGILTDFFGSGFNHLRSAMVEPDSRDLIQKWDYYDKGPWVDDTGNSQYVEEIIGLFVPPFTANYSFYLAADQSAYVSLHRAFDDIGSPASVRSFKGTLQGPCWDCTGLGGQPFQRALAHEFLYVRMRSSTRVMQIMLV